MTGSRILSIDLETFSDNDIREGVYKYSDSPNFEILLCAYAFGDDDVTVVDLAMDEDLPSLFISALTDPTIEKHAFNAAFERVCLSVYLRRKGLLKDGEYLDPMQWWCTSVHASMFGLPRSLKDVARVLQLEEQKDTAGVMLINYFAKPCKPTKSNGGRTRNYWYHHKERWAMFKSYNAQDVVTERAISRYLDEHYDRNLDTEKQNYAVNEIVNDNGILIDTDLCRSIVEYNNVYLARQVRRAKEITGLENPNSLSQLKPWLMENGMPDTAITKDTVPELIKTATSPDVREVLQIRQRLSATSVTKYQRMLSACCSDGRVHGVLQFYGANRTGRFAGRLIQTQNFPKNHIPLDELDAVRTMVKRREWDDVEVLYDDIQDLFKQLLRTALIAPEGYVLSVADYSAIEARVSAWMAHETWAEAEFHGKGKIYEATAAQMFNVPIDTIAKGKENYELRQRGKVATLACIAEGQLIPTDSGLKPIETVTSSDLVWDGENWVKCGGAVYQGTREVITYDGITGTADHICYTAEEREPIHLGVAAESGSCLLKSKPDWKAVRKVDDHQPGTEIHPRMEWGIRTGEMPVREHPVDTAVNSDTRTVGRVPDVRDTGPEVPRSEVAVQKTDCSKAEVHESEGSKLSEVRCQGDQIQVRFGRRSMLLPDGTVPEYRGEQVTGTGQNKQQRELRAGEPSTDTEEGKPGEPGTDSTVGVRSPILALCRDSSAEASCDRYDARTDHSPGGESGSREEEELERNPVTARVYDILNAGPNHRYAVSGAGVIVHNCGYGGSSGAMAAMDVGHKINPDDYPELVRKWRTANPNIVRFWRTVEDSCMRAMTGTNTVYAENLAFKYRGGNLFIRIPSGRWLTYFDARIDDGQITYMGTDAKGWTRLRTFGGKLVENIVQATARDCLADSVREMVFQGLKPIFHVHDEIICEIPAENADAYREIHQRIMTESRPWEGQFGRGQYDLYHPAPGFTTTYYLKD